MLKAGGRIAYVTCSVLDEENGAQVRAFLARHPEFSVQPPAEVAKALGERAFMFAKAARLSAKGLLMTPRTHRAPTGSSSACCVAAAEASGVNASYYREFPDCAAFPAKFLRDNFVTETLEFLEARSPDMLVARRDPFHPGAHDAPSCAWPMRGAQLRGSPAP